MSEYWTPVGYLTDVPRRGSRQVITSRCNVAVFRTSEDRVFALEDRCPHKGGPLSQGIIHDTGVACPLHNWVIDLETGRAREPDRGCVRKFPVRVRSNVIEICFEPPVVDTPPPEISRREISTSPQGGGPHNSESPADATDMALAPAAE